MSDPLGELERPRRFKITTTVEAKALSLRTGLATRVWTDNANWTSGEVETIEELEDPMTAEDALREIKTHIEDNNDDIRRNILELIEEWELSESRRTA